MIDKLIYRYLLSTDGINQVERSLSSLDPTNVKIDGRSKQDIIRFLSALSSQIRYFDQNNMPLGDWRPFLNNLMNGPDVLPESQLDNLYRVEKDCPPHLALLFAFLKIYAVVQQDLNKLSSRRLNFYYENVLKILRRKSVHDQVHVIFELVKNSVPTKLELGTILDAGTTSSGKVLHYALENEYIITHAMIGKIMSDLSDHNFSGETIIYKTEEAIGVTGAGEGWRPFGASQQSLAEEMRNMTPASLGCAVASPNFLMAEGTRKIELKFALLSTDDSLAEEYLLNNAIHIEMTGEDGWLVPDKIISAAIAQNSPGSEHYTLTILIEYNQSSPPISRYNESVHLQRLTTNWPVWRMTVKSTAYMLDTLSRFIVSEVEMAVDVKGITDLMVQNDVSLQQTSSPIFPFGQAPSVGSNFYVGSEEVFSKTITSLNIHLNWKDTPENLQDHYAGYENNNIANSSFSCDIYLLAGKSWDKKLNILKQPIFNTSDTSSERVIGFSPSVISDAISYSAYKRWPDLTLQSKYTVSSQQGFIKLVLVSPTKQDMGNLPVYAPFEAFGHKVFAPISLQHALLIGQGDTSVTMPQPPYTPALSSISLDYTAKDKFRPDTTNLVDQFFLLENFGAVESTDVSAIPLVPKQSHQGALYIGLEKSAPSQLLSFFFQIEEGSTPGTELLTSDDISWSYLAGSKWKDIPSLSILEERTEGFQTPGLIRLILGTDASEEHTLMPSGYHWIRASVMANVDGAADVLSIYTQAARASLVIPDQASEHDYDNHLSSLLKPESIKGLKKKVASIKKTTQPYPSFGGRPSESDHAYHQRVHERLRHRNRGVTSWDFERLILETFPIIFKVKALPHTNPENNLVPGEVKLVVVPDWRKRPTGNPLQPKANRAFLNVIEAFIKENLTSQYSNIYVSNPVYETLLVDCKVSFQEGYDPGFYAGELDNEVKRFLSPWAYDDGEDIVFGGKIHASEILAFIEGREYVNYVTDFELYHRKLGTPPGGISEMQIDIDFEIGFTPESTVGNEGVGKVINEDFIVGVPVDAAVATQPDAILVSSDTHRIRVVDEDSCQGKQQIGIGDMVIGLDFVIVT